jgi:hypothetical protein
MNTGCIAIFIVYREMPKPDLYIYLYQNSERLLQNIKREEVMNKNLRGLFGQNQ